MCVYCVFCFFFFNDTATTEIYTLSLHDALPICLAFKSDPGRNRRCALATTGAPDNLRSLHHLGRSGARVGQPRDRCVLLDRKSTRLNSSHANISYAVFCLKKKK